MFGDYFGKPEIVELMVDHSVAKRAYSKKTRKIIRKYGYLVIKLFGYPLSVGDRLRARIVIKYLNPKNGDLILDVGCGIGYYSFELATKFGCKANGIDIDKEDIRLANQMDGKMHISNPMFIVGDTSKLPFHNQMFDKVILSEVIEHIRDDREVLEELNRILKCSGYLVLSTPHVEVMAEYKGQKLKNSMVKGGHVRNGYSRKRLTELLETSGFSVVECAYVLKKSIKDMDGIGFIVSYPFWLLFDNLLKGSGECIIVKAKRIN